MLMVSCFAYNLIYAVIYYQVSVLVAEQGYGNESVAALLSTLGTVGKLYTLHPVWHSVLQTEKGQPSFSDTWDCASLTCCFIWHPDRSWPESPVPCAALPMDMASLTSS